MPELVPARAAKGHLRHARLPPECFIQDWRDLPRHFKAGRVDAGVDAEFGLPRGDGAALAPGGGQPAQLRLRQFNPQQRYARLPLGGQDVYIDARARQAAGRVRE